jgi:hypothetical protein
VPGGVRFSCLVGNPNGTEIRQYEVVRATLNEAVLAVLEKIDQSQR